MSWAERQRPQRFKIYAPDGSCRVAVGWLHMGYAPPPREECYILFTGLGDRQQTVNKLAVVVNAESGEIAYNPRRVPDPPPWCEAAVLTAAERKWLAENPQWPKILELDLNCEDRDRWRWDE